jgi:hypothetical protein
MDDWVAQVRLTHQIHKGVDVVKRWRLDATSFFVAGMLV